MKIKICGITTIADTEYLNQYHIDFAGMVLFFPKSKRNIDIPTAKTLISHLNQSIKSVAVVVEPTIKQMELIAEAGFDYIQIHGRLSKDLILHCPLPILKAFNVHDMEQYEQYRPYQQIAGYVFDAAEPGSGTTFDWNMLKALPKDGKLRLLAGGLNAGNVTKAIAAVSPDGVDISSGVEYADKPCKDPEKLHAFIHAVRSSLN